MRQAGSKQTSAKDGSAEIPKFNNLDQFENNLLCHDRTLVRQLLELDKNPRHRRMQNVQKETEAAEVLPLSSSIDTEAPSPARIENESYTEQLLPFYPKDTHISTSEPKTQLILTAITANTESKPVTSTSEHQRTGFCTHSNETSSKKVSIQIPEESTTETSKTKVFTITSDFNIQHTAKTNAKDSSKTVGHSCSTEIQLNTARFSTIDEFETHLLLNEPFLCEQLREIDLKKSGPYIDPSQYDQPKGAEREARLERILKPPQPKKDGTLRTVTATIPSKRRKDKSVLTRLQKEEFKGPLSLLARCVTERCRVKIWVRSRATIRSTLLATVLAFDKHWNLVLADVDETYFRPKKTRVFRANRDLDNGVPDCVRYISMDKKYRSNTELMVRHVNQMLLHGDNVVMIAKIDVDSW